VSKHEGLTPSSAPAAAPKHRPDIDGIRAVAVLLIVLDHAGVAHVRGGFVGVDVFFVLSGYLITSQLVASRDVRFVTLLREFYARRARRILPALALVTICTLILGQLVLLPTGEQQDLSKSAIASSLFVSNLYFLRVARDYFAGPSELQPLLHTWSLSVEEQFYLFWPLLLTLLWTAQRRLASVTREFLVTTGIGVVAVVSFLLSTYWSHVSQPVAFFATPSRVWELGIGGLVAQYLRYRRDVLRFSSTQSVVGAAAILLAGILFSPKTPFPGVAALLPVIGTALLIISGNGNDATPASRVLSLPSMRFIGTVSYSWYLWHWPLLAIARATDLGQHRVGRDVGLIFLALGLATISTRWVENPIRFQRVRFFRGTTTSLLAGAAATLLVLAVATAEWRTAHEYYQDTIATRSWKCAERASLSTTGPCLLSNGKKSLVFLVGDSHADHWSPAVAKWANRVGAKAIERAFPGCPSILVAYPSGTPMPPSFAPSSKCAAFGKRSIDEIRSGAERAAHTSVIISAHWNSRVSASSSLYEIVGPGLDQVLDSLDSSHIRALIIGQTPEFAYSIPSCVARRGGDFCRVPRNSFDAQKSPVDSMLKSVVARHTNARFWDPVNVFCGVAWCSPSDGDTLLFRDTDHLSRQGALAGSRLLEPYLDWLLDFARSARDFASRVE